MLNSNVWITAGVLNSDDDRPKDGTQILLWHWNEEDAVIYSIYRNEWLGEIQKFRIIRDIHDLFNSNSLHSFLTIMDEFADATIQSSLTGEKETHHKDVREYLEEIKEEAQRQA